MHLIQVLIKLSIPTPREANEQANEGTKPELAISWVQSKGRHQPYSK